MFKSARLKLTAWYLLIVLFVSLSFSIIIFQVISRDVQGFAAIQRFRLERRFGQIPPQLENFDTELVEQTMSHLLLMLAVIDGGILLISGGLGYFLAGRTLKPIVQMVDEQNRFISDASHELRTPLTSLKSAMEVSLRDSKLTLREARRLITDNIDDVNKLQLLSDQLLQLAQYQKPGNQVKFEKVNLDLIVTKAVAKIKPLAQKRHLKIITDLRPLFLFANPLSLSDLLTILLDNAIKYSPNHSTITITTNATDHSAEISIQDQGIGIDPSDIPHIFDRFYRADAARSKQEVGGYGLGLSIAKKIVDSHHGALTVQSLPGQGSTFIIHLPLSA